MGRTPKPISILCTTSAIAESKEVQALAAKGHTVVWAPSEFDLILGPEACGMDETLLPLVGLAVRRTWERLVGKKGDVDHVAYQEGVKKASRKDRKRATAEAGGVEGDVGEDGDAGESDGG